MGSREGVSFLPLAAVLVPNVDPPIKQQSKLI